VGGVILTKCLNSKDNVIIKQKLCLPNVETTILYVSNPDVHKTIL
jgi:hypothetical protein